VNSAMLDLETLSLEPDAAVLSVGVAIFTETEVIDTIGWALDLAEVDGHIDMNTLKWWMHPDRDAARDASFKGTYHAATVGFELKTFLAKHDPKEYWANDPEFDLVVLKSWWKRQNARAAANSRRFSLGDYPLGDGGYKLSRSYRTIIAEAERLGFDVSSLKGSYVAHDPVEDAAAQARAVIAARQMIGQVAQPPLIILPSHSRIAL